MKLWWAFPLVLASAGVVASACGVQNANGENESAQALAEGCGGSGQTCCAAPQKACTGELGCAGGTCQNVVTNMVAYAEYCKEELGFTNPRAKLPYLSCYDAPDETGARVFSGSQAKIQLTVRDATGMPKTLKLLDNGPLEHAGKDVWDNVFGSGGAAALGCDNPNYLSNVCDPFYRLNVFRPDPQNRDITAAIHCRDTNGGSRKPSPANAISAEARRRAYLEAPEGTSPEEKARLFAQYNDTNEIVLIMANARSGKACFFHVQGPYFGTHFPAPDNEDDVSNSDVVDRVWNELPVRPPFEKDDRAHQSEWLRNGASGWRSPDNMQCTSCHDSGPWMHNPFIDSAEVLPNDRATRPYIPLPQSVHGAAAKFVKTDPVQVPGAAEREPQKCTSCHSIGSANTCGGWLDRAVGLSYPQAASAESQTNALLGRYMPDGHEAATKEEFYRSYGAHIDALKCCCEHSDWSGCRRVDRESPQSEGTRGTNEKSCTNSTTGGWHQPCEAGACNHSGLRCVSDRCQFRDE